jgi:hypothetical protein
MGGRIKYMGRVLGCGEFFDGIIEDVGLRDILVNLYQGMHIVH